MKRKFYIILLAVASISTVACKKDFLEKTPSEQISNEQLDLLAIQDPTILNGYINGIYGKMFEVGSGGTTGHDDFGQKGYDMYADMLAGDMVLAGTNYGWYSNIANLTATVNYTVNQAYMPWRYYYSIIYAANTVIESLGGNDANPEEVVKAQMIGQAKALRAYAYFYLANFYSKEGYGTGNEKILPLYIVPGTVNNPKSTAKEIYDQMVDDLDDAIVKLDGFSRGNAKHAVNQSVAKGLLSYVLAARGANADLQRVVSLTNEIISSKEFNMTDSLEAVANFNEAGELQNLQSGFNSVSTKSWMWAVDLTLANNLDLVSWWGQVDLFTYSYAWAGDPKIIDDGLYAEIKDEDIRKRQFDEDLWPINKFFAPDRRIGGQRNVITDYVYMRLDEMVLLNAEANARLGNSAAAIASLKSLLKLRFADEADYSYVDGLSGSALLKEIYLQTRIELWGEGKTYLALKRNKESLTRGSNHLFYAGDTYQYNDPAITFLIPQAEELNNPNLNK